MEKQDFLVGVVAHGDDWETMNHSVATLEKLGILCEKRDLSPHYDPDAVHAYAVALRERGMRIVIAGDRDAAQLPARIKAKTPAGVVVLGVPVPTEPLQGVDALLSTLQMPAGCSVPTFPIGKPGAINAALHAADMLSWTNEDIRERLEQLLADRREESRQQNARIQG